MNANVFGSGLSALCSKLFNRILKAEVLLMYRKVLLITGAALILSWLAPQESRACSCIPPRPPAEAAAAADAVFLAKVIAFEEMPAQYERLARLEVGKIWKGRLDEADSVFTGLNSAACGYDFQVGGTYLIYAYRTEPGRLWTGLCTRNNPIANAGEDLKYLESFSLFPLAVGNAWEFAQNKNESIVDTLRLED